MKRPLALIILDGWGCAGKGPGNTFCLVSTPSFQNLLDRYPDTTLTASGEVVGLPAGQMGNSEVGHLNIGAGRVVYQDITRIIKAVRDGEFFKNPVFNEAMRYARDSGAALHIFGLVSDGGVHSHMTHLYALLEMAANYHLPKVFLHAFLDGRDVPPSSAKEYIGAVEKKFAELGTGAVSTLQGRFYAMDRDKRWDRVEKAYHAIVNGEGVKEPSAIKAIDHSYANGVTDEFMVPTVIVDDQGRPKGQVKPGDVVIFYNYRSDRAREITHAFTDPDFKDFERPGGYPDVHYVCMTQYDVTIKAPVAFPPQSLAHTLGEVLAEHGLKQLRIAETEKYAHVTFFFNGGVEKPNPGEERILIPSPKVSTYDLKPEMSANEVTDAVLEQVAADKFDVIILNYANPDMLGHTGKIDATMKAIQTVDTCLGRVVKAVVDKGGALLVTADHGNAEKMLDDDGKVPHTAHTVNPVPFILVDDDCIGRILQSGGSLQDIAPTMLALLGIDKPPEMTGHSLLLNEESR